LLCGVALALRVGWVIYRWHIQGPELDYPDEHLHWQLATNLVRDGLLVTDDGRFAARMPAYPLFLALFAGLGPGGILLARLAQAGLGAGTVGLVYRWARAAGGRRGAVIASGLVCCDPFAIFFCNLLLTEVPFTLLAIGATAWAWKWQSQAGGRRGALLGLALLGPLLVLTRPSAIGWVVLLWGLLGWRSLRRGVEPRSRPSAVHLLVCPLAMLVLLFPWGLRNKAVLGSWAWLSTNGGVTLYDAQGPQADGSSDQSFLQSTAEWQGLGEVALDRALTRRALEQMRADPARAVRLAGVKLLRTWSLMPNVAEYRTGQAALAGAAYTLVVLVGAVISTVRGVLACRRTRSSSSAGFLLLWLPVLCFTLVHCVYVGSVRYRTPLMPFLALLTGWRASDNTRPARPNPGCGSDSFL
jgi:hypothetical protein